MIDASEFAYSNNKLGLALRKSLDSAQAGLEPSSLPTQPPECGDSRYASHYPAIAKIFEPVQHKL